VRSVLLRGVLLWILELGIDGKIIGCGNNAGNG